MEARHNPLYHQHHFVYTHTHTQMTINSHYFKSLSKIDFISLMILNHHNPDIMSNSLIYLLACV